MLICFELAYPTFFLRGDDGGDDDDGSSSFVHGPQQGLQDLTPRLTPGQEQLQERRRQPVRGQVRRMMPA
jgi:hypothetical protein